MRSTPLDTISLIEAYRRADGSAHPEQFSPQDLQVVLKRIDAVVPYQYFGFN